MMHLRSAQRAVTLIEVVVAAGLFSLVMTAILSFYVEAIAVSAKRDEQSQRLRRYHIGLDKMEQFLREGRIMRAGSKVLTFFKLSDIAEKDGFPDYEPEPFQFVVTKEGVLLVHDEERRVLLPLKEDETVTFGWVQYNPPNAPAQWLLRIAVYRWATAQSSQLVFSRIVPNIDY